MPPNKRMEGSVIQRKGQDVACGHKQASSDPSSGAFNSSTPYASLLLWSKVLSTRIDHACVSRVE